MENQPQNTFEPMGQSALLATLSDTDRVAFYKKTYAHVAGGF